MDEQPITKRRIVVSRANELDYYRLRYIAAMKYMNRKKTKASIIAFEKANAELTEVLYLYDSAKRLLVEFYRSHPSQDSQLL